MTVSQHEPMNENKIENKNESSEFWFYLGTKLNSFMQAYLINKFLHGTLF